MVHSPAIFDSHLMVHSLAIIYIIAERRLSSKRNAVAAFRHSTARLPELMSYCSFSKISKSSLFRNDGQDQILLSKIGVHARTDFRKIFSIGHPSRGASAGSFDAEQGKSSTRRKRPVFAPAKQNCQAESFDSSGNQRADPRSNHRVNTGRAFSADLTSMKMSPTRDYLYPSKWSLILQNILAAGTLAEILTETCRFCFGPLILSHMPACFCFVQA